MEKMIVVLVIFLSLFVAIPVCYGFGCVLMDIWKDIFRAIGIY